MKMDSEVRQKYDDPATYGLAFVQARTSYELLTGKEWRDDGESCVPEIVRAAYQEGMRAGEIARSEKCVYTISVVSGVDRELRWREWGYYFNESHAREAIEKNCTDISENDYYHFGILSRKGQGPLAIPEVIQWYEFIYEGNEFVRADKIECPEQYRHMAGESGERLWPLPAAPEEKK